MTDKTKNLTENIEKIRLNIDYEKVFGLGGTRELKPYTFVITGPAEPNFERHIGYVVQVRKKWGAFGTDAVFLRTPCGGLMVHENQCFFELTQHQINSIKDDFKYTAAEESKNNPDFTYSIKGENEETGFLISPDNAPDRVDSFSITITKSGVEI